MKKLISLLLALVMVFALATVALAAENQEASFIKTYKLANPDTINPEETFEFKFTKVKVEQSEAATFDNMPSIPQTWIPFASGQATVEGLQKNVSVALQNVQWPGVGVYYYLLEEIGGNTAGVGYDSNKLNLKVTVAFDEGTNTYYTAFVTVSLDDANGDGTTDVKTGGFTNVYSAGSLSVQKIVTGNLGDQTKDFNVTVEFTAPEGKEVKGNITYVDGTESKTIAPNWVDGKATAVITLKHNETVTFTNIPYGVTYTVVEDDYTTEAAGKYDPAQYSEHDGIISSETDSVVITNNKNTEVDTGVVLDSMPYVLLLAVAVIGMIMMVRKKRSYEN